MKIVKECLGKVAVTVEKDYWKLNKTYDRLVIVELKNQFKTFISRKPVPAGTLITDRDYWIPFSSLTEEITTQYNAILTKTEAIEAWYDQLNTKVNQVNTTIQTIYSSVNDLRTSIKAIDEYIKNISPTGGGDSNMVFDPILNIPKWLDSEDKWVDAMGIDVTTYRFAEDVLLDPSVTPGDVIEDPYLGYTVLGPYGSVSTYKRSTIPGPEAYVWESVISIQYNDVTFAVESDQGIYKRINNVWTKVGEFV